MAAESGLGAHQARALFPDRAGTYALTLHLGQGCELEVGRLGQLGLPAGYYVYVGSGRGPGGIAARVGRHLSLPERRHWHVDYLRDCTSPVAVWFAEGVRRLECVWAAALLQVDGGSVAVPGFGSSDCRCCAHLIHFAGLPCRQAFAQVVGERVVEVVIDASYYSGPDAGHSSRRRPAG